MADEIRSDLPGKPDDEIAAPDPDARKEFESREKYRGFKMPRGMSLPQRRAWRKSIDERMDPEAKKQRKAEVGDEGSFWRGVGESGKEAVKEMFKEAEVLPELGKTVGGALIDAATVVPRTKAAIQSDPKGSLEFVGKAFSGDREAGKKLATKASEGIAEPFATMGDVALAKYAAEEGDYGTAALYGGLILVPSVVQTLGKSMSKGWLKSAAEAGEEIPDEAAKKMNDLAKRVDEGKVTDDMQIRRELAAIEDAHKAEYMQSKPLGGGGAARSIKDQADEMQSELERMSYAGQMESEGRLFSDADDLVEDFARKYPEDVYAEVARRIKAGDTRGSETFYEIADPDDYLPSSGGKPPGGGGGVAEFREMQEGIRSFLKSSDPDALIRPNPSPKFGLSNQGHHNVVEDLGPLLPQDRNLLEEFAGKFNLSETELRQLRDEYVAYGYDDFPSRSQRGFEEIDIPDDRSRGGGPPFGKPPGGEVEDLFPHKNLLDKAQKSGLKIPRHLRGASGKELLDRPVGTPKEFDNPGFVNMIESRGLDTDYLNEVNQYLTTKRNVLKERYDYYLQSAYSNYPNEINTFALERADEIRLELESSFFTGDGGRFYNESRNSIVGHQLIRFANEAEKNRVDFGPIEQAIGLDVKTEDFGLKLERALMDEITRPDFYKNPMVQKIKEGFDRISKEPIDPATMRAQYMALEDMFDDYQDDLVLSKQLLMDGLGWADNHRRFMEVFQNQYYAKYELVGNRLVKNELPDEKYRRNPMSGRTGPVVTREWDPNKAVDYDDLEGPSEAEIDQMVSQSQFGDPYQLEMLKEDMRRMAELEQGAQIERGRVRSTRTPGTPGASGKIPEGTSRAERKGGKRERPKPKTKKDKYEN